MGLPTQIYANKGGKVSWQQLFEIKSNTKYLLMYCLAYW
jgi:hypothetical protein